MSVQRDALIETIPAGELEQACLHLLDEVRETGQPIIITKRGDPRRPARAAPRHPALDRKVAWPSLWTRWVAASDARRPPPTSQIARSIRPAFG